MSRLGLRNPVLIFGSLGVLALSRSAAAMTAGPIIRSRSRRSKSRAANTWHTLDAFDEFDEQRVQAFIDSFERKFNPEGF